MKRFSISLVLAAVSTFVACGAFGQAIFPAQPALKTIAVVVAHAHHSGKPADFLSATDKL